MKSKAIIMLITALLFNVVAGSFIGLAAGIEPRIVIGAGMLLSFAAKPLAGVLPMAINITSAYDGEVLEKLLVKATTGNELVSRGLIRLEPNVSDKLYLPRMRAGKMLQKRKEQPVDGDSKGDFNVDERVLKPQEFMAFTTFNPRSFEKFWRPWQPKGELVFSELPAEIQNKMLEAMANSVDFELGWHFLNGRFGSADDKLFDGIVTRILSDEAAISVDVPSEPTMIKKLKAVHRAIPKHLRRNPNLRFLVSIDDADTYDDELSARETKGANYTDTNAMRYKGVTIEPLGDMPDGLIIATIACMDETTNLWAGVNLVNDFDTIKIAPLTNAGERYFFKMLMKADTNTAWGDEVVVLDDREKKKISVSGKTLTVDDYVIETTYSAASDGDAITINGEPELGARVHFSNTHATNKAVVSGVEVPAKSTVILSYNGTKWFSA